MKNTVVKATSWSFLTQIAAKIIPPVSNMILARQFAPEVFGIIATITMVTSFADTLSESGFQKYIVSKTYREKEELYKDADVAFWTNLGISFLLWGVISLFRFPLCRLLGNPGLETAMVIACMQIPITSLSSIQVAVYQREYNFRKPFICQLISSVITLFITLGLASYGIEYWAIIIGNIAGYLLRALILSVKSEWMPHLYFNLKRLKTIFEFSVWIMAEGMAVWLSSWFDSFIVGNKLSAHDLGIYKNSQSVVNGLMAIPQNGITNVLIVTLSRNKDDVKKFNEIFLNSQRLLAYLLLPMGFGVFLYKELAVRIVFGIGWDDAEFVVALWSIASIFRILLVSINSAVYIAKGKPKISLYLQVLDIIILMPLCIWGIKYGLKYFIIIRCVARLDIIVPSLIILEKMFSIPMVDVVKNLYKPLLFSIVMCLFGIYLKGIYQSLLWQFVSLILCAFVYMLLIVIFSRNEIKTLFHVIKK